MRVKKTLSGWRVTMAGAVVPAPPPPVNVVCVKLAFRRMFLLRYQFKPVDQACAAEADVAGLANTGKAALSMSSLVTRDHLQGAPLAAVQVKRVQRRDAVVRGIFTGQHPAGLKFTRTPCYANQLGPAVVVLRTP